MCVYKHVHKYSCISTEKIEISPCTSSHTPTRTLCTIHEAMYDATGRRFLCKKYPMTLEITLSPPRRTVIRNMQAAAEKASRLVSICTAWVPRVAWDNALDGAVEGCLDAVDGDGAAGDHGIRCVLQTDAHTMCKLRYSPTHMDHMGTQAKPHLARSPVVSEVWNPQNPPPGSGPSRDTFFAQRGQTRTAGHPQEKARMDGRHHHCRSTLPRVDRERQPGKRRLLATAWCRWLSYSMQRQAAPPGGGAAWPPLGDHSRGVLKDSSVKVSNRGDGMVPVIVTCFSTPLPYAAVLHNVDPRLSRL